MTLQEFEVYLNALNKKPGEYTKDEIYELGKMYRNVDNKRWDYLSKLVGWSNGESLRCYVKNRLQKDGQLQSKGLYSTNLENINVTSDNADDISNEIEEKLRTLFKEQTKYRDIMNAYRRSLRNEARVEVLVDAIKTSVKELEALPKVKSLPLTNLNNNEAVLLISDLHIGVECDNFYNTYNSKVASERLSKLANETIKYCARNKVKRLNILNLGDLIHGIIHTSARVEQEMDVISQVMTASELLAETLNLLQNAAPEVVYRSCSDNHSRMLSNKHESIEQENLFRLVDWYLQERLKGTKIEFKNDNIDVSIGKFDLMNGKKMVFCHGHNCNINTAVQMMNGATREFVDYVCMGHYHCEKVKSFQGSRVVVNGSIVGTEQYALSKGLFSKPSQILMIFENDSLNTISIEL